MAADQGDSSSFLQLPPELLSRILCELPGPSVAVVACTCRLLRAAASSDSVWRHRCRAEYRVWVAKQSMVDAGVCFRELYTNCDESKMKAVLAYAILQVEGYWIIGWMYMPPRDPRVSEPMRRKPLFRISLGALGTTQVHCMYGHNGPHMAHIQISTNNEFSTKCVQTDFHRMSGGRQEEFRTWLEEEWEKTIDEIFAEHTQELILMKFIYTSQYDNCLTYKRIFFPRPDLGAPLLPGLFKGTYGSHGLELVLLSFHGESAHVTKITGDPNVPAGQTSLQIDMSQPLVLDYLEQQQNLQALVEIVSQWETWQASTERQIYPEENDDDEARQEEAEGYSHSIPEEGRWLCRRLAQEAQDGGDKLEEQSEILRQKVAGSCCLPIGNLDRQCESDPFQAEGQSSSRPQQVGSIVAEEVVLEHDQSGEADAVQEANENGRACEEVMCPKVEQPVDEGQLRREMNIRWEREGQQVASREAQGLLVCEEFHLPPEVLGRLTTLPRICRSRYYGKGLIAGHGFTSPQQTPGIFVHFDDDTFGFLWLQLQTFSIYSRVHEYLPRGTAPSTRAFLDMLRELGTIQA